MAKVRGTEIVAAGRLSKDAEIRYLSNGMELTQFGFFVNCEVVDSPVDLSEVLTTGRNILIRGPLNVRSYTHQDSGETRLMFQVAAKDIQVIELDGELVPLSPASAVPESDMVESIVSRVDDELSF